MKRIKLEVVDWIIIILTIITAILWCFILDKFFTYGIKDNVEPTVIEVICECDHSLEEVQTKIIEEPETTDEETEETLNYLGNFKLTAYCACEQCCGEWSNGITSTGTVATQGRTIAVDPSVIPYGSEVSINGNTYIAEDCGGAIDGNRIDVYFDSHSEALEFGIQYADVYLVGVE